MRLLLDEMYSHVVAGQLRRAGVDALAVSERATLRSKSDDDVLAWATGDERALVSENARDMARIAREWAAADRGHAGIVITTDRRFPRRGPSHPGRLVSALRGFVTDPPMSGSSWVWYLR